MSIPLSPDLIILLLGIVYTYGDRDEDEKSFFMKVDTKALHGFSSKVKRFAVDDSVEGEIAFLLELQDA